MCSYTDELLYNEQVYKYFWLKTLEFFVYIYFFILSNYNAPFRYKFHRTELKKKSFMPNNRITENYYPKHNNIRTSK